jgi:hypothetical protein
MALVDDVRSQLWWSLGSLALVLAAAFMRDYQPHRRDVSGAARA